MNVLSYLLCISYKYIVPGFNEHVRNLHSPTCSDYISWRDAGYGKPRSCMSCRNMTLYKKLPDCRLKTPFSNLMANDRGCHLI